MLKLLCALAFAACAAPSQIKDAVLGSISGVVRDVPGQNPLEGVVISLSSSGVSTVTLSDAEGRYGWKGLPPDRYIVSAEAPGGNGFRRTSKVVRLNAGQELVSVDLALPADASISGKVLDEEGRPVPHIQIRLVVREYRMGALVYSLAYTPGRGSSRTAETDEKGAYSITGITDRGRGYLVMARDTRPFTADAPDPKLRTPVFTPAYFPGTEFIETAEPILLRAGERREGVDIRMKRSSPRCVGGILNLAGKAASFEYVFVEDQPSGSGPARKSGPDGRFRICNLHPGDYRLSFGPGMISAAAPYSGFATIRVRDEDREDLKIYAEGEMTIPVQAVWDGEPPDKAAGPSLMIDATGMSVGVMFRCPVPGRCQFRGLAASDYVLRVRGLPAGLYVKEMTYGGLSVLRQPMRYGSAVASSGLRVVIAHDGGFIGAKVADADGEPVPRTRVYIMPDGAVTPAALSAMLVSGTADQNGAFRSTTLAPGKYAVLASETEIYPTPEGMEALWRARSRAKEVEIGPRATAQVALMPVPIE